MGKMLADTPEDLSLVPRAHISEREPTWAIVWPPQAHEYECMHVFMCTHISKYNLKRKKINRL